MFPSVADLENDLPIQTSCQMGALGLVARFDAELLQLTFDSNLDSSWIGTYQITATLTDSQS